MAKGFTPIIGLAVVVALAMVAVFGAMSLTASPAAAQDAATDKVENVVVHVTDPTPALLADRLINNLDTDDVLAGGATARFEVVFEAVGTDTAAVVYTAGDELKIDLGGFVLPDDQPADGEVRIWVADAATAGDDAKTDSEVKRIGSEVTFGDGDVSITVPDFGDSGASDTVSLNETEFLHVVFFKSVGIKAPEGLTTNFQTTADPPVDDTAKRVNWSVNGVPTAAAEGIPVAATYSKAPPEARGDLEPSSTDPGDDSQYIFDFTIDDSFNGGLYPITIKMEEFGMPGSIDTESIAINVMDPGDNPAVTATDDDLEFTFNPATVTVDGKEIIMTVPEVEDTAEDDTEVKTKSFNSGSTFRLIIYQSAGVTNPGEANTYGGPKGTADEDREIFATFGDSDVAAVYFSEMMVPLLVEIDPEDGGRGETIVATGKGFKNGTSLTFWLESGTPNGVKGAGEDPLCTDDSVSDNIGTCEFTISNPPFAPGDGNYVNAVDGAGKAADMDKAAQYELKPSITVTPAGGNPGQTMLVQLVDFDDQVVTVKAATLAGEAICGGTDQPSCSTTLMIPNTAEIGSQRLEVVASNDKKASKNVVIGGPSVFATPNDVVPNQRISLNGNGFTPNSTITNITIGSESFAGYPVAANANSDVRVDNSGRWATSVVIPVADSTVSDGTRTIRVTDKANRHGTANVTIPARSVTINPPSGRVGTLATVRGENFPGLNDDGQPVSISITYEAGAGVTVSAVPNADGSFAASLRIPTNAAPGATNTVRVEFTYGETGKSVTTVTHEVPAGTITLSSDSGTQESEVTITGTGFRSVVPINLVTVGGIDVTPSPKPRTDGVGGFEFSVFIPGLGIGVQTIEVTVGGGTTVSTASVGYEVTASGVAGGATTTAAAAVTPMGENFVRSFHFNNDTKMWTFYDPMAGDASTQTHFIAGETYWILVEMTVNEVILNNESRNLTCVEGNCWNQIVW